MSGSEHELASMTSGAGGVLVCFMDMGTCSNGGIIGRGSAVTTGVHFFLTTTLQVKISVSIV